jgi:predicted alpha/beta-fold hydrolase
LKIAPIAAAAMLSTALSLSTAASAVRAAELLAVPSRGGVTEKLYVDAASSNPPWVVVLFAGGDGAIGLRGSGAVRMSANFLVRTARYWPQQGDASALFDAPSDESTGMEDTFRLSDAAQQDVAAAVAELRKRYPSSKIALIGTSRGTITVGNVLKRSPALADAYVLTSPVTVAKDGQSGLSGMSWEGIHARVLVLSNEHDGCIVSPFDVAKRIADANRFDFIAVSSTNGAENRRAQCGAESPHGYLGIDQQVLDTIRGWLGAGIH